MWLLAKFLWIPFIIIPFWNGFRWWARGAETRARYPERRSTYSQLILNDTLFGLLPIFVVGLALLQGIHTSMLDAIFLLKKDQYSYGFWAVILIGDLVFLARMYTRDGAQAMIDHPGYRADEADLTNQADWRKSARERLINTGISIGVIIFVIPALFPWYLPLMETFSAAAKDI